MEQYVKPSPDEMAEYVKKYDKRIGLRMLYKRHSVPESERHLYRQLWDEFRAVLPDAFEKDIENASEDTETAKDDGDSPASAGQALQEE